MPSLIVVGGPNGAGKSTFVRQFLTERMHRYLCADEAAYELCPENPESVGVAAGRLFIKRMAEARESMIDVIIESTLSGKSFARQIEKFLDSGYGVEVLFITPMEIEQSVERVRIRVRKGGHLVPENDIRRRFLRCHKNFWNVYRSLATEGWAIFSNGSGVGHRLIAGGLGDFSKSIDEDKFEEFLQLC